MENKSSLARDTELLCKHCGDSCSESVIRNQEYVFCCNGCKIVFELLKMNGLTQYYDLEEQPGISLKNIRKESYAYLEEPDVRSTLLDFSDGNLARITFYLPAIHCASCLWLLENLYRLDAGVQQSKVNFLKKEVYITFDEKATSLQNVAALLHRIGYPPVVNLSDLDQQNRPILSKTLYYKLGVTGFLLGNIMLLSFPEYLGLNPEVDHFYHRLFGMLNLILAIPLVFYSGWDYLRNAWIGLSQGNLNIDLPIAIGIISLFGRSVYEIISQSGAGYLDSLAGLIFFLLVGKWFQQKTYHHISFERDYQSYFPIAANVLINKKEKSTSLRKLQKGDRIRIRHGELIPADGILTKGIAHIDYSFVTGESEPQVINKNAMIYAGGRQMGGAIELDLKKNVVQSYLVQLWNDQVFKNKKTLVSASQLANKIGKYFTFAILLIASQTLVYWWIYNPSIALNAFTAVLIIACPCAVALAIPFTFGNVMRLMSRRLLFLKNTNIIEAIQQVTHIVFDKTGTLTERWESLQYKGDLTEVEKGYVKSLALQSGHPRSQQISLLFEDYPENEVIDFNEELGKGITGRIDGHLVDVSKNSLAAKAENNKGTIVQIDNELKGSFFSEPLLRSGIQPMLKSLDHKFHLSLLSGDSAEHQVYFENLFANQTHFNQSPKDKLVFIKELQKKGAVVMMIGDGLNDAGALKQADVGVVISESNNNFSPACDAVIDAKTFQEFPTLIKYLQQSKWIVYACYAFALLYNFVGLHYAVQGLLSPVIAAILMPLSSVTIILIGMLGSWLLERKIFKKKNKI